MRGVTLIETIISLALLGVILAISGMALSSLRPPAGSSSADSLERARAAAITTGTPQIASGLLFLPDGRIVREHAK